MTQLFYSVWDLDGTEHKMTQPNVDDMVRHNKWTTNPITSALDPAPELGPDATPAIYRRGSNVSVAMVKVTDRDGKEHYMDVASAKDMVAHLGWTTSSIVAQRPATPDGQQFNGVVDSLLSKKLAAQVDAAANQASPSPKIGVEDSIDSPINLNAIGDTGTAETAGDTAVDVMSLDRTQLVAYARDKFDMAFGEDVPQDAILNAILAETE